MGEDIWESHGTPWHAGGVTSDRFVIAGGPETEGIFSLGDVNIFPSSGPGPVAIAAGADMAAFIVKACNAHDALVKALEEVDTLAVCTGVVDPKQHVNMLCNIARIAREALAKVSQS